MKKCLRQKRTLWHKRSLLVTVTSESNT